MKIILVLHCHVGSQQGALRFARAAETARIFSVPATSGRTSDGGTRHSMVALVLLALDDAPSDLARQAFDKSLDRAVAYRYTVTV